MEELLEYTTCRAKGMPICETEPTILKEEIPCGIIKLLPPARTLLWDCMFAESSSKLDDEDDSENEIEESSKEPQTNDDEMQLEDIRAEVEKKKQQVDLIDKIYELSTADNPVGDPTVDMQVELNSDNVEPEILNLQRSNHKLREQIKELEQCCTSSNRILTKLRTNLNRDMGALQQLQRQIDQLDSFQRTLERESVLCGQRYRYLERDLYDWDECNRYIATKRKTSEKELVRYVARVEYMEPKLDTLDRLKQTKFNIKDALEAMHKSWASPRSRRSSMPNARMGSEVSAFLQRNLQLFNKESH